jgi:hypothetical protein
MLKLGDEVASVKHGLEAERMDISSLIEGMMNKQNERTKFLAQTSEILS